MSFPRGFGPFRFVDARFFGKRDVAVRRPEGARRERYRLYVCRIEAYIVAAGGAMRGVSVVCGVGQRRFRCGKIVVAAGEERCGAAVPFAG